MVIDYFTVNTVSEEICFLTALGCLIKDKNPIWRSMILFLLITVIVELGGIYLKHLYKADPEHVKSNSWIYNLYRIIEFGFISLVFSHLFKKYFNSKPIIIGGLAILAAICLYEISTYGIFKKTNNTASVMSVMFVIYSLSYYYNLLKDESYVDLRYAPGFWWVAGVLFFYFGDTACNVIYPKLSQHKITPQYYSIGTIYKALNVIFYSCWSYSFICRKWLTPTSEHSF